MSIQMVNGYSCANCAEASLAKRGIDPHESEASKVEVASNATGKNPASDPAAPQAVESVGNSADVRAKLDYAHNVDRLI